MDFLKKIDGSKDLSVEVMGLRNLQQILYEHKSVRRPLPGADTYPKLQHCKGETMSDRYALKLDCDEVYPNILIGDEGTAKNRDYLKAIGVTHVLNVAQGSSFGQVSTSASFYRSVSITYKGLNLLDLPHVQISNHFDECTEFITAAVNSGGKILVHCLMGLSRSSTMVLAYLMKEKKMRANQALKHVLANREIRPNDGFLRQLVELDVKLFGAGTPTE